MIFVNVAIRILSLQLKEYKFSENELQNIASVASLEYLVAWWDATPSIFHAFIFKENIQKLQDELDTRKVHPRTPQGHLSLCMFIKQIEYFSLSDATFHAVCVCETGRKTQQVNSLQGDNVQTVEWAGQSQEKQPGTK